MFTQKEFLSPVNAYGKVATGAIAEGYGVIGLGKTAQVHLNGSIPKELSVIGINKNYENTMFIYRYDDNFYSTTNTKGKNKAHLNEHGDLVPANINGTASIQSHVRGGNPENSPYISFSDPRYASNLKHYGKNWIAIDINNAKNIEVINHKELTDQLKVQIKESRSRYLNNPTPKNKDRLIRSWSDLLNSQRDEECLIKGCVPSDYLIKGGGE